MGASKLKVQVFCQALMLGCGFAASSCEMSEPAKSSAAVQKACSLEAEPGIFIDIRDSVTQAPLHGATLRIFSRGRLVDSASSPAGAGTSTALGGVYERPGVYDVTVDRSGFAAWRRDSIRVIGGECHVTPVRLVAEMRALR